VAGMIRLIGKTDALIGDLNRDLPACSVVPQSATLPGSNITAAIDFKRLRV
jgi:hypothetical protein